jgi:hypothetical protein
LNDNNYLKVVSMKKILLLAISLLIVSAQLQAATEISPGAVYPSGSDLKVSTHGIELKVPDNWQAMLPRGSDLLLMQSSDSVGRILVTFAADSDAQAVKQMLSRPHALDAMTRIKPAAEVTEKDGLFTQSYQVTGVNLQKLVATAYGRLGDNQTAAFVIVLEPENQSALSALGKQLIQSIAFSAPKTAAQVRAESSSNINWVRELSGRTLEFARTDDGRVIKKRMNLCSDGRVKFTDEDRFAGKTEMSNFSAKTKTSQNGRWQVSGNQLQLFWSDGSREQYSLSQRQLTDSDESGMFLDDERWFNKPNRACR